MSYNMRIWSIKRVNLPECLPLRDGWKAQDNSAYYAKKDWQIVVNNSVDVENEDISDGVPALLPGVKYLTEVILEPILAPDIAKELLNKVVKKIAKEAIGVIENQQEDTLSLPTGINKYTPIKRESKERFSILEMSWWFDESSVETAELLNQLISYFEDKLPEALPKRYGLYEPPQFKYQETGKQHFLQFLSEHVFGLGIVWYPTKPVVHVSTGFVKESGFRQHGGKKKFKANHFSISFDSNTLNQPGWKKHLADAFMDISKLLRPFYGEVRTLHNYISGKATYYSDSETEHHPVRAGWWTGIPQVLGQAIVVGNPYIPLWSKLKEKGILCGDLYFLVANDWAKEESVRTLIGDVPKEIAQLKAPKWIQVFGGGRTVDYNDKYPLNFPFQKQVDEQ